jgi:hypothetical protein
MMGRKTLREVREALAAAKAKGKKAPATSPIVEELESLARRLEQEAEAGIPPAESRLDAVAEQGAAADGGGQRGSRRASRPRSPRRRRA